MKFLCAICCSKPNAKDIRILKKENEEDIKKIQPDYDMSIHPIGICGTCRIALNATKKDETQTKLRFKKLFDYSEAETAKPRTRNNPSSDCQCDFCKFARLRGQEAINWNESRNNQKKNTATTSDTIKICQKCWTEIARGKKHICQTKTKKDNIEKMVRKSSVRTQHKLASSSIDSLVEEQGISKDGGKLKIKTGGSKPLELSVGKPRQSSASSQFSHDNLKRMQTTLNLSDKQTLKLAGAIRTVAGKSSVEPHLAEALVESKFRFEDYYKTVELKIVEDGEEKEVEGVFCTDVEGLVADLIESRDIDPDLHDVHIGLDGGQGSIKIGLSVTTRQQASC